MKNILEKLYIWETEENPQLLPDRKNPKRTALHTAYDEFFGTLSEEQKQLYFTYEKIRGEVLTEENAVLYKCAFQSGFQFAQEIFTSKKKLEIQNSRCCHTKSPVNFLTGGFNGLSVFL